MKKRKILALVFLLVIGVASAFYFFSDIDKKQILINSLSAVDKIAQFLPIEQSTKDEIQAIDKFVQAFTVKDGIERRYLVLLQNNMELRPTGGFLGQYAVMKLKDGEVTSLFVEDANLLDQRIKADVNAPYPFEKMMSIKRWKFRDSNFFPDFPTSVDKIKYFYRLSGGNDDFDGVIAVNATILNDILEITGPVTVPGYPGTYTSENAILKLEEQVEKSFELQGINVQDRKLILKKMAAIIVDKLGSISNISKVPDLVLEELRNKDVQFYFEDPELQALAEKVNWAGKVDQEWDGDYLMAVDANLGALKSDYYMEREMIYSVDLTLEKPTATLEINYTHNAVYGDWRTTDYHSYLRVYTPLRTELVSRAWVSYPNIQENHGRQYFG
ncbi:MAG: DUF4012 domain-containing protein, partial [Candidatus Moranbacteria bacterium]|nr:DUF4012 domain-containing protein [Candidatus Moranbacteria bacterium]